eukprot:CAMPEP_0197453164 /NCGR_PEP_ID=MMETSP1175-20131217/34171_1 /TAXON_ID=1003142 /ORGANISM="Triceratium dubium, Strain CCMP147" /LENGTH=81 /DNA_ID=CAMNT_0042986367 /DNA_START=144 /DNA_END=389 /DNA_ORIENTATION=-
MTATAAARTLQRRAIQCSFSSVFHLRGSGMMEAREAAKAERIFLLAVALPLGVMGMTGAASIVTGWGRSAGATVGGTESRA